jgi:hypothetical protein
VLPLTPALIAHLRRGLLSEMAFAADRLSQLAHAGEIHEHRAYKCALWTIDGARKVLAKTGLAAATAPDGANLSDDDYLFVVYRALKAQLEVATTRAQEEALQGRTARAKVDAELETAVGTLRMIVGNSASAMREARLFFPIGETRIILTGNGHLRP